jgi:RNA polymerase primary sigma factor
MSYMGTNACQNTSSLNDYITLIKDGRRLTADEERGLAEAIARGDRDARTRMIQANLLLVVKIAREYMGRGLEMEDLVGEGNLGLIRAVEDFDPSFGTRFSTYASYWIKQAIRQALNNTTATIRLPVHMVRLLTKWRRAERVLHRGRGTEPTFEEIASYLGLSQTERSLLVKACHARRIQLGESIQAALVRRPSQESRDQRDASQALLEAEEWDMLLRRMECLDSRERSVLEWRYGLEGDGPMTLKEIGHRLGVTRESVRKIELRAFSKLDDREDGQGKRRPRRSGARRGSGPAGRAVRADDSEPQAVHHPHFPFHATAARSGLGSDRDT